MTLAARLVCSGVRVYQFARSGRPSVCRYVPSCSNYALEAFEEHGMLRGAWLTACRLGRCHPWGRTGWDPVPSAGSGAAQTLGLGADGPTMPRETADV